MWTLGTSFGGDAQLAAAWHDARPFPHVVLDDVIAAGALPRLLSILDEEPVEELRADIFRFEASAIEPRSEGLRELRDAFARSFAPVLSRVTGRRVARVDMRAYAYREGHYLLPHTDHQDGVGRVLAYAYYVPSPEPPDGGELELFACDVEDGAIVRTESAKVIAPQPNRLVVFEVSDVSLHQVREVLAGLRVSLAGWFYP